MERPAGAKGVSWGRIIVALALVPGAVLLGGCTGGEIEGVMDRITMPLTGARPVKKYDYRRTSSKTPEGKYRNTYLTEPGQSYTTRAPK